MLTALILLGAFALSSTAARAATAASPGSLPCLTNALPADYGTFLLLRDTRYLQSGGGTPTEATAPSSSALAELVPPSSYGISNAVLSGPGNFQAALVRDGSGVSSWTRIYTNEAAVAAAIQPGSWNSTFRLVFTNGASFVGFFPFLVSSNSAPVPTLANLAAAQAIPAASPFTLTWSPWIGSSTNDRISLVLTDDAGTTVFSAATDCGAQVSLPVGASGVEIPAGRLAAGRTYNGYLTFGASLFDITDAASLLLQRGFQNRTTQFSIRTTGGGGGTPGTIGGVRVSGTNLVFTLTGAAGSRHTIQSTLDFVTWRDDQTVTLPPSGTLEVTLPLVPGEAPRFYRAQALGGVDPNPGSAAELAVALVGPNLIDLTVRGTAGATYRIEGTTTYTNWTAITNVALPAGVTSIVARVAIPAGTDFFVLRAVGESGPTPPGNAPTVTLTRSATGLVLAVTAGDPNRAYTVQSTAALGSAWAPASATVTTDATGQGTVTLSPVAGDTNRFYRVTAP